MILAFVAAASISAPVEDYTLEQIALGMEATWSAMQWKRFNVVMTPLGAPENEASTTHPDRAEVEHAVAPDGRRWDNFVIYRGNVVHSRQRQAWDGRELYIFLADRIPSTLRIGEGRGGYQGNMDEPYIHEVFGLASPGCHVAFCQALKPQGRLPTNVKVQRREIVGKGVRFGANVVKVQLHVASSEVEEQYEFELDPERGFWPRFYTLNSGWKGNYKEVRRLEFRKLKQVGTQWFPEEVWDPLVKRMYFVSSVELNMLESDAKFRIDPLPGVRVEDSIRKKRYIHGGPEGETTHAKQLAAAAKQPTSNASEPPIHAEQSTGSTGLIVAAAIGAGLIVIAAVWVFARKR